MRSERIHLIILTKELIIDSKDELTVGVFQHLIFKESDQFCTRWIWHGSALAQVARAPNHKPDSRLQTPSSQLSAAVRRSRRACSFKKAPVNIQCLPTSYVSINKSCYSLSCILLTLDPIPVPSSSELSSKVSSIMGLGPRHALVLRESRQCGNAGRLHISELFSRTLSNWNHSSLRTLI